METQAGQFLSRSRSKRPAAVIERICRFAPIPAVQPSLIVSWKQTSRGESRSIAERYPSRAIARRIVEWAASMAAWRRRASAARPACPTRGVRCAREVVHLARYRLQALAVGLAARFRPELQQPRGGYFDPFPADVPEAPSPCFIRYGRTTIGNLSARIAQSPSWERVTRNSSNSATPARISSAPPTAADGIEAGVRPIHDDRIVSGEAADGRYSAKHPMHPEEGAAVEVRGGCGMATRPDGQYHQRGYRADRKEGPSHRRRLAVPPAPLTRLAHHCAIAPADGYAPETGRRPAVRPG